MPFVVIALIDTLALNRNCSENYEFVQAVCHFTHDTANNQQTIRGEGNKIYSLYVAEAAPLRVALSEDVRAKITEA